ncbi:MAG: hypothetical protein NVSMB46_09420 [Candidatus Saccharimonadales bacterium]
MEKQPNINPIIIPELALSRPEREDGAAVIDYDSYSEVLSSDSRKMGPPTVRSAWMDEPLPEVVIIPPTPENSLVRKIRAAIPNANQVRNNPLNTGKRKRY